MSSAEILEKTTPDNKAEKTNRQQELIDLYDQTIRSIKEHNFSGQNFNQLLLELEKNGMIEEITEVKRVNDLTKRENKDGLLRVVETIPADVVYTLKTHSIADRHGLKGNLFNDLPNFRTAAVNFSFKDIEKKQAQTPGPIKTVDKNLMKAIARIKGDAGRMKKERKDEGEKLDWKDQLAEIKEKMEE